MIVRRYGEYCTAEEVLEYLKLREYEQEDIDFLNNIIIPNVDNEIDNLAGTSWGVVYVENEYHRMGYPVPYGFWLVARPVYLNYYPVIKIDKIWLWQGGNEEVDFTNGGDGRLDRWWLVNETGVLWVNWMWWYAGRYDVRVSYYYGYGMMNEIDCGTDVDLPNSKITIGSKCYEVISNPDGKVKMLSILMSAYRFLDSERYSNRVADNISDPNTYITQMSRLKKEISELREWVKGVKVMTGGQI